MSNFGTACPDVTNLVSKHAGSEKKLMKSQTEILVVAMYRQKLSIQLNIGPGLSKIVHEIQ